MRTIEITEANEWNQTLTDVAQSLQDKAAILNGMSDFDKKIYDEIIEIKKKLSHPLPESRSEQRDFEKHNKRIIDRAIAFLMRSPNTDELAKHIIKELKSIDFASHNKKVTDEEINDYANKNYGRLSKIVTTQGIIITALKEFRDHLSK